MTRPKKPVPGWQFDEFKPCGIDYTSIEEVGVYDMIRAKFRDYEFEVERISERSGIRPDSVVIDMGCGTGSFSLRVAKRCKQVYAVDVSETMLDYCREQAEKLNLTNIIFSKAGLLTYEHEGDPADVIVCVSVFHLLPDFWKQAALKRCYSMLKPGGRLYIYDIVMTSDEKDLSGKIDGWIKNIEERQNDIRLVREMESHVKDDYITYDWIMEGLVERSGFSLEVTKYWDDFQAVYVCCKK